MQIFTRAALLGTGHTDASLRRAVVAGHLVRLAPGLYADVVDPDPVVVHRELALTLPPPSGAVWSRRTAALLEGLPVAAPPKLQALRQGSGTSWSTAVVHMTSAPLETRDLALDGPPRTSLARTVVDVARSEPFTTGVVAADAALALAVSRGEDLAHDLFEMLARMRGMKGIARARAVVDFASPLAESPQESRSRVVLARLGLPAPVLQYPIRARGRTFRADMAWPEHRTVGEYDGQGKYRTLRPVGLDVDDVVLAERERQLAIEEEGWVVVRWGNEDLRHPSALKARILAAFERGDRLRALLGAA